MYKYYSTQRTVSPGTFPKGDNPPIKIHNFDEREAIGGGLFWAWGYLIYEKPLTQQQIDDYELREENIIGNSPK